MGYVISQGPGLDKAVAQVIEDAQAKGHRTVTLSSLPQAAHAWQSSRYGFKPSSPCGKHSFTSIQQAGNWIRDVASDAERSATKLIWFQTQKADGQGKRKCQHMSPQGKKPELANHGEEFELQWYTANQDGEIDMKRNLISSIPSGPCLQSQSPPKTSRGRNIWLRVDGGVAQCSICDPDPLLADSASEEVPLLASMRFLDEWIP